MKRASGSTSSRSPARQKKRLSSSKPSGAPSIPSMTWGRPPSGRKFVNAPSAFSTASRSILPRSAATMIGIGSAGGCSSLKPPRPRPPAKTSRRKSIVSETFDSGRSNVIWFQPSTMRSDDEPMPSAKRPLLSIGHGGGLLGEQRRAPGEHADDAGPSRTRSVSHAASASGVKPSGPFVSPDHRSVYPAASARRMCSPCPFSGSSGSGSVSPQRLLTAARPYQGV